METRQRKQKTDLKEGANDSAPDAPSDDGSKVAPPPKDDTPEILKEALKDLPPRWKNWWIRGFFSSCMLLCFALMIWGGPIIIMLVVFAIQVKCFHEIITIGHRYYQTFELPWFRTLSWYFLACANYFFYLEARSELLPDSPVIGFLLKYHRLVSFTFYLIGFIMFVLSLVKKMYKIQFFMLSPKKTWEGFIGGGFFTVILGWFMSGYLAQYPYLTCPTDFDLGLGVNTQCEVPAIFQPATFEIPLFVQVLLKVVGLKMTTFVTIPFQLHCVVFSLFSSIIAPFGGFFASGFKRAFKVKDFGDIIPGHGGMMDRFDCQFLMATFVHVYMSAIIRVPSPSRLLPLILALKPDDQVWLFEKLKEHLKDL